MKSLIRNFIRLIQKHKTVAILNFTGLTLAFAVIFIVAIQVNYDLGYNRSIKDHEKIYRVKLQQEFDKKFSINTCVPKLTEIATKYGAGKIGITGYSPQMITFGKEEDGNNLRDLRSINVNKGLLHVLAPKVLQGDTSLIDTRSVSLVLTQSIAKHFFGNEYCVGKRLYSFYNGKCEGGIVISAVIEDIPKNCTFHSDIWMVNHGGVNADSWSAWSYSGYIQTNPEQVDKINEDLKKEFEQLPADEKTLGRLFSIDPITDIYLSEIPELKQGNRDIVYMLLSVGVLVLFIALFNLLNLQIALIPTRLRLFATMRALGFKKNHLRGLIVSESILFTLIAIVFSFFVVNLVGKTELSQLFQATIQVKEHFELLLSLAGAILVMVTLVSIYPSWYASSAPLAEILKGGYYSSKQGLRLRRYLITIQFIVSITVLILAFLIRSQHQYLQTRKWGLNTEHVLYLQGSFPGHFLLDQSIPIVEDLKKDSRILDCAFSREVPGTIAIRWGRKLDNQYVSFYVWPVSHNFIEFMGIEMKEGKSLQGFNQKGVAYTVVNKTFQDTYQFPDIYQVPFSAFNNKGQIVGITEDFNFNALTSAIEPLALICSDYQWFHHILIKVTGEDIPETMEHIRKVWKKHNQPASDVYFLDKSMEQLYYEEENLSTIIFTLSMIALIISVMGVYGLTMFSTQQRRKEIAIRKVNGATNGSLIWLLQKAYIIPIGVAFIIATPVSFLIFQYWIRQYPYQVEISPLYFILALLIVTMVTSITMLLQCLKTIYTSPTKVLKSI